MLEAFVDVARFGYRVGRADVRKWIWITPLALVATGIAGTFLALPWASREAKQQAEARGLELAMADLSLGWMSAKLKGVELRPEGVEGVVIRLREVEVDLSMGSPRIRRIFVSGGHVELTGSLEHMQSEVEAWRQRRPAVDVTDEVPAVRRRTEIIRNLDVTWRGAFGPDSEQIISGLNVDRGPDGQNIGIDLIRLARGPLSVEIAGASLKSNEPGFDLAQAEYVGASEARITYRATAADEADPDSNGQEALAADNAPEESDNAAASDAKNPAGKDDDKDNGLSKKLEQDSGRVARLMLAINLMREKIIPRLPPHTGIEKLSITYLSGRESLHIGPSKLTTEKAGKDFKVAVIPGNETKGTPLALKLKLHPASAENAVSLDLEGGPVSLKTLGIKDGAFGLAGVNHTTIAGHFKARLSRDAKLLEAEGDASIEGLGLNSERLSDELVAFPRLSLQGKGKIAIDGTMMELRDAELTLGEARFQGAFEIEKVEDHVVFKANAEAPLVSCQALVDSAPRGILGPVERMLFEGTFSLDAGVEADTRQLSQMQVRWNFKNGCRAKAVPAALDPERFRGLFQREVIGAGNFPMQAEFGPHSPNWTSYDEISPYLESALLVSEDGRFFRHNGFDDRAIESAIRDNTRAGKFVRGASTISMQLAKNLYLSRNKTLARKFQEAALTSLLEQSFEKRELLELYMNIVEFGPGIYGVRAAAQHYFNTSPARLSAAQAFFLGSILPAPTREYFEADGHLNPARAKYVRTLLGIAEKRGRLSPAELEEAQAEELVFGQENTRPSDPEPGSPEELGKFFDDELPDPGALSPPAPQPERPGLPL